MNQSVHHVFIVMGVSGSGKSVVASSVAQVLNAAALDGDYLQPRANIEKMASGEPLNDEDRAPWLDALNDAIFAMQRTNAVSLMVCSALKKIYRDRLRAGNKNVSFIYLHGEPPVVAERLQQRKGHFFKAEMLATQFATLQEPGSDEPDVLRIEIDQPLEGVVHDVVQGIKQILA